MNFKFLVLSLTLSIHSFAYGATPNVCDELEEAGDSSQKSIDDCRARVGISDYYKEKELKRKIEDAAKITAEKSSAESSKTAAKISENIETKIFTAAELNEAGFGKPFFAVTDDYRSGDLKQERVTEGNTLCTYLGYEKASKSTISQQMNQEDSNKKGLIISTGFFGGAKSPTLYKQEDPKVGARKYVEITCVKRKDKKAVGASDALKSVVEALEFLPGSVNSAAKDKTSQVVDDKRETKRVTTPHGFKTPDWMRDNVAPGSSK